MRSRARGPLAKVGLAVAAPVVFFGFVELLLVLGGVEPVLDHGDPFVGFAANVPLFVPDTGPGGREWFATSDSKLELFNPQRFSRPKKSATFRIFCLGGSTTFGRPYTDKTSFAGWLRVILPAMDPGRRWEVINAGGISYASYRVARLMEELKSYQPDLFVVYAGHNEFLEERTYSSLKDLPAAVKLTSATLAKTRTWAAMGGLMRRAGLLPAVASRERFLLPEAVNAKLDRSAGLDLYERDDPLRDQVLSHYRSSLERMVAMAKSVGAELIFVTPAANLRSISPFKSQHATDLAPEDQQRAEELLQVARQRRRESAWADALSASDEGIGLDPRFADLHYERGRALFSLERYAEAKAAFVRAKEEDVCPLRSLEEMHKILEEVAAEGGVALVDFDLLLQRDLAASRGHTILGEEDFLDHVHPTIEAHRRLALALAETMKQQQLPPEGLELSEETLANIVADVEARTDRKEHAEALASLAWTLDWAGKAEESRRLAFEALESGVETPRIVLIAGKHHALLGNVDRALELYRRAVSADPLSPTPHYQLGLLSIARGELEEAAAHFFLATVLWPDDAKAHEKLGLVMAERGRYDLALTSLMEAKRRDPGRSSMDRVIAQVRRVGGVDVRGVQSPGVDYTRYASGTLHKVTQTKRAGDSGVIPHGIQTEWHEDGNLSRLVDYFDGEARGSEIVWDEPGLVRSPAQHEARDLPP